MAKVSYESFVIVDSMFCSFFISIFDFLYASFAEVYVIVKSPAEKIPFITFEIPTMYSPDEVVVVMAIPVRPPDIARPHTNKSFFMFFVLSYILPKTGADTTPDIKPRPVIKPAVDEFIFK